MGSIVNVNVNWDPINISFALPVSSMLALVFLLVPCDAVKDLLRGRLDLIHRLAAGRPRKNQQPPEHRENCKEPN